MRARILAASTAAGLEARLAERFAPGAAALLAARHGAAVLEYAARDEAEAGACVRALAAAGAAAAASGSRVGTTATAEQLTRAAADPDAAEGAAALLALLATAAPARVWRFRDRSIDLHGAARVMAIVNVTPDSFYERAGGVDAAVAAARGCAAAGAAVIDIGGRSYAHWNPRIPADEERARVAPAVAAVTAAGIDAAVSVDTTSGAVAAAALAAGAHAINDCSGLADPALLETVAAHDAGLVVMHLQGELNVAAQQRFSYGDAMSEVVDFLYERTQRALAAGVARDALAVDPGLEFGKDPQTDLTLLDRFGELRALGYPIVLASSRKSFIGRTLHLPAAQLLAASLATAGIAIAAGARIVRTHDVAETVQFARMTAAIAARGADRGFAPAMPGTPPAGSNSRSGNAVSP